MKLRLKILLLVMLGLVTNVFPRRLDVHWAHAEPAVAGLPREIGIPRVLFFDPTRPRTLELFDNLRRRVVLGLCEQDVDVVAHGTDLDERRAVIPQNAGDVGMEFAALLIAQELAAVLRAEYEMDDDVGNGLGHAGVAPTGLGRLVTAVVLGLRSSDSLLPRLSHGGPSALTDLRAESP